jgi:hypothetical protein
MLDVETRSIRQGTKTNSTKIEGLFSQVVKPKVVGVLQRVLESRKRS